MCLRHLSLQQWEVWRRDGKNEKNFTSYLKGTSMSVGRHCCWLVCAIGIEKRKEEMKKAQRKRERKRKRRTSRRIAWVFIHGEKIQKAVVTFVKHDVLAPVTWGTGKWMAQIKKRFRKEKQTTTRRNKMEREGGKYFLVTTISQEYLERTAVIKTARIESIMYTFPTCFWRWVKIESEGINEEKEEGIGRRER